MANNVNYSKRGRELDKAYGPKAWSDGMFNEGELRSHARAYRGIPGGKEEFFSFCHDKMHVPNEVLERAWKHVNG